LTLENPREGKMADQGGKTDTNIQPNLAGLLCYLLGWITGLIFLIIENKNQFVRFHALQSILTFGAITVVEIVLVWIPGGWIIGYIIWALAFVLWVVLMYEAYQGKMFKLPVVGDIAERQSKPNTQK
jgi:uncharacterized membrane protein